MGAASLKMARLIAKTEARISAPIAFVLNSRYHRFWQCERFETFRRDFTPEQLDIISRAPEFLTCYGWSLRPHTLSQWLERLQNIPEPVDVVLAGNSADLHLFKNGSCLNQSIASCRIASWAVVQAGLHD